MDDFDGELPQVSLALPQVSLASLGLEFLLDNKCIEKLSLDSLAVDSHIPLVCPARLVKSTHLVVEVDWFHVFVIFRHNVAYLVVAFDNKVK